MQAVKKSALMTANKFEVPYTGGKGSIRRNKNIFLYVVGLFSLFTMVHLYYFGLTPRYQVMIWIYLSVAALYLFTSLKHASIHIAKVFFHDGILEIAYFDGDTMKNISLVDANDVKIKKKYLVSKYRIPYIVLSIKDIKLEQHKSNDWSEARMDEFYSWIVSLKEEWRTKS